MCFSFIIQYFEKKILLEEELIYSVYSLVVYWFCIWLLTSGIISSFLRMVTKTVDSYCSKRHASLVQWWGIDWVCLCCVSILQNISDTFYLQQYLKSVNTIHSMPNKTFLKRMQENWSMPGEGWKFCNV